MTIIRKVLDLLNDRERRQAYLLVPLVIFMALAEVGGIASVAPFLSLMADPEIARTNPYLAWTYDAFGFESDRAFLMTVGFLVMLALIASNAVMAGGNWVLARFGAMRNHSISRRLLTSYLKQPYSFFLTRNSAGLANNILQEVLQVINGIVIPGLQAIARGVAALAILGLLVFLDPGLALLVGLLLGGAYGLIYYVTRRYLTRIGRERLRANQARHQAASEALGGIKDLKLSGRETELITQYSRPSHRFAQYQTASRVIGTVPKYAIEAIAFSGMIGIVLFLLSAGRPVSEIVPVLGLYAFAGYRLLPSLQQVFAGLTQIRYSVGALDEVHAMVRQVDAVSANSDAFTNRDEIDALEFQNAITLKNLTYRYSDEGAPVLRGIDLEIPYRTSAAFVGTTGAGKTTIIDVLLGLLIPDEGGIEVDGIALDAAAIPRWQKQIGYVPQSIFLKDDTVARNIAFGLPADMIDMAAVKKAARIARIDTFIDDELPHGYDTFVGERGVRLSGGQRQRLGIARALYHDPEVLVLDEATSALDGTTEKEVFSALNELAGSKTIIMIAHRLSTIQSSDRIFLLDGGRVVARGSYEDLMAESPRFRAMAADGGDKHVAAS